MPDTLHDLLVGLSEGYIHTAVINKGMQNIEPEELTRGASLSGSAVATIGRMYPRCNPS